MPDDAAQRRRLADRAAGVRADRRAARGSAATAAAEPPLRAARARGRGPTGSRSGPNAECSVDEPIANSSMFVLPRITAPASRSRSVMWASYGER